MRATSDHSRDRAGARSEVEGDARSYGVPVNVVECKKLQEQGRRIPAKDSSTPRARLALPPGNEKRASGSRGGSREKEVIAAWKRGSQSLFRREDGASVFGPPHHGKAPVDVAFGRHAGPTSRRSHRRAGDRSRRASRGVPSTTTMNGGGGPAGPSRSPPRTVHADTRILRAERLEGKRIRRFVEVPRVPNRIRRLLIEWRSILPELAVHPAGDGQQGRVLDVDSVRDHPRPCGKGAGCTCPSGCVVSVRSAFGRIGRGRTMKARPAFVFQPREFGRFRSPGFVSRNQSRAPSRHRRRFNRLRWRKARLTSVRSA